MNKQQYFQFAEQFFGKCLEISKAKNADYTGGAADPFANFKAVEVLGISTEQGFLTRMMDKMKRIASFAEKGELQVKDESVTDTLRDLANYACLLAGYIESQKGQPAYTFKVEMSDEMAAALKSGQAAAGNLSNETVLLRDGDTAKEFEEKPAPIYQSAQPCLITKCVLQMNGGCNASPLMYSLCKKRS